MNYARIIAVIKVKFKPKCQLKATQLKQTGNGI